jgi:hypothetical protein
MKAIEFGGSNLGDIQQLGVISRPPALIGECPLTGDEVKVLNDRFVVESRRSTQGKSNGLDVKWNKVDCPFDPFMPPRESSPATAFSFGKGLLTTAAATPRVNPCVASV